MQPTVASVDGEVFPLPRARRLVKGMFFAGFVGLPLLWFTNIWLFWPCFRHREDEVIVRYVRWSIACLVVASALFLPWLISFSFFGRSFLSPEVYNSLDITQIPVRQFGV